MEQNTETKSKTLTLQEIFKQGQNCFRVPDYQRAYSWEEQHRQDLINDIENIVSMPGYRHFTGTIVAQLKEHRSEFSIFDIVDGQQRLTSLVILLSVIAQGGFVELEKKEFIYSHFIARGRNTGNTKWLFQLNGELDHYFSRKLEKWDYTSEEHTTKAHTNLDQAFIGFKEWLDLGSQSDLSFGETIFNIVTTRLLFLFHVPETSAEVGLMFEIINNRGKRLSELEKIKNYLIYYAEKSGYNDINVAVTKNWGKILYNLNACGQTTNELEDRFLRNTWIVFEQTNKSESYHVYENLKQRFPPVKNSNWYRLKEYIEFIADSAEAYNKFLTQNNIKDKEEAKFIKRIFYQASTASVIPLLLSVYSRIKVTNIRVELIKIIETLNFRYYGCGITKRSDTGNGELFGFANTFYNKYNEHETNTDWLKNALLDFMKRECGDEKFIRVLTLDKDELDNFKNWNNLKYFLANYEDWIAINNGEIEDFANFMLDAQKDSKNASFDKEHILATNECSIFIDQEDVNKRRLGNFVLLRPSVNKSIQDAPIYEKLIEYENNTYLTPRSLAELKLLYGSNDLDLKYKAYTEEKIIEFLDKREEKLLNFALARWSIGESKIVKINSNLEGTKIYYFEL